MLLIISETTTDALLGEDYSLMGCFIMVCTLVAMDYLFSKLKDKSSWFSTAADGAPLIIVDNGKPLKHRMERERLMKVT